MPEFVFDLPLLVAVPGIVGVLCLFAWLGLEFVRRRILPRLRVSGEDSEFTGAMVQAIMVFYGLAMALIAVSVWETHSGVSGVVSLEASRVAAIYRDVGGYPQPTREELRRELRGYLDYLIDEAWPAQRRGERPAKGIQWMDRFQGTLHGFQPETEAQKLLHAETLRAFNLLIEARRLRLDAMLNRLSGALWFVIGAGALISISATFFFSVEDARLHRIQVLLLAGFVGLVISLIAAFDRPFRGDLGVGPESYQFVREQLMDRTDL